MKKISSVLILLALLGACSNGEKVVQGEYCSLKDSACREVRLRQVGNLYCQIFVKITPKEADQNVTEFTHVFLFNEKGSALYSIQVHFDNSLMLEFVLDDSDDSNKVYIIYYNEDTPWGERYTVTRSYSGFQEVFNSAQALARKLRDKYELEVDPISFARQCVFQKAEDSDKAPKQRLMKKLRETLERANQTPQ